ncbi:MAG: alpha/beta hydrolase [Faecalicoccus sp.]|nr:alpha/beta hydrolase [Faecalicoccus sp.]
MILKFDLKMRALKDVRTIHMYLPDDYLTSGKTYPVLYMFDGQNLFNDEDASFGMSWRLADTIRECDFELIIVGQECSHRGNDRLMEYSPYPFYDIEFGGWFEGYGNETMDFFIHDLKPYIDSHFPTKKDRDHTWICGSSCGGEMALYAGIKYPEVYSKTAALSPYLIPTADEFIEEVENAGDLSKSSFYISWGAMEGNTMHAFIPETKIVTEIGNRLSWKKAQVFYNVKEYGSHTEFDWGEEAPLFLDYFTDEQENAD